MKPLFVSLLLILLPFFNFSQNIYEREKKVDFSIKEKTNFEMYSTHYSFKNYSLNSADENLINQIDFNKFEQFRKSNEDTEIFIEEINKTLILFSKNKVKELKLKN